MEVFHTLTMSKTFIVLLVFFFARMPPAAESRETASTVRRARAMKTMVVPKWYNVQQCKDKTHSLIIRNFSFTMDKNGAEYADADFDITAPAQKLHMFRAVIHRCPLGVESKCEYFNTFTWTVSVCNLILSKKMMWTPVLYNIHPRPICPIRKGFYRARNITLDWDSVDNIAAGLNVDKFAWPVEAQVFSENGLYVCYSFVVELKRLRAKES